MGINPAAEMAALPEAEQLPAMLLIFNLSRLQEYANEFAAAADLLATANNLTAVPFMGAAEDGSRVLRNPLYPTAKRWRMIAARDAALSVYHFGEALAGLRSNLREVPTIAALVNSTKLRSIARDFSEAFPNNKRIRHATGHRAELAVNIAKVKKNGVKVADLGDGRGTYEFGWGRVVGSMYEVVHEGERFSLDVAASSHALLNGFAREALACFPEYMSFVATWAAFYLPDAPEAPA